jgi:hypothetical protein
MTAQKIHIQLLNCPNRFFQSRSRLIGISRAVATTKQFAVVEAIATFDPPHHPAGRRARQPIPRITPDDCSNR